MRFALLVLVIIFLAPSANVLAQGCSDAGFCTIGSIKPQGADSLNPKKQHLTVLLPFGLGDEGVIVYTPGIQYDVRFNKQWALQARLTANYATGSLGNATGLGDIFLATTYSPVTKHTWKTAFTFGTKLPLNNSNITTNGKPLPLQYQSSLGTVDVILGASITNKKWQLATAYQQPITGSNGNTFLPEYWGTVDAAKFSQGNNFKRKADVLLRASYNFFATKQWKVNGGLLGVYHLGKDTYTNALNQQMSINGSEGLTLNGTFALWYQASKKITLGITGGAPFVVRDVRADGLTRSFVVSPELIFQL
ncbi:MAG: hypothetical protein QM541_09530 [Flavobacterium sp.]|nr:hypothetical protein [Flavobacterium sp.]